MLNWDLLLVKTAEDNVIMVKRNWKASTLPGKMITHLIIFAWIVCHTCDNVECMKKACIISDFGGGVFSGLILWLQTKCHAAICSKSHRGNLQEITRQEWADIDILSVLKTKYTRDINQWGISRKIGRAELYYSIANCP